jgi:hypothetical protein
MTMSERGLRRIVMRAMTSPFTLPIMGGSLLAAVIAGVHLGDSAIGHINPIYFQGPAVHPRDRGAAIDERQLNRPRGPAYADLYGWDEGAAARAVECGDCVVMRSREAVAYSAVVPYFGPGETREPRADPAAEVVVYRGNAMGGPLEPSTGKPDVSRYTDYPLTYEEAAFPVESAPPAPEEVPTQH